MNSYKTEIGPNEPSLRVGNRIPDNTVNLAYVNGPGLVSADAVELFDYSRQIPEDTVILDDYKREFYVGENRILVDGTNNALAPIENVLVTNYYKELPDKTWVPLYYKYTARFRHHEKNPPYTSDNCPIPDYLIYLGHNIAVLENDIPTNKQYVVFIEDSGTAATDGNWIVHIYSEFTSDANFYYTLQYSKWDSYKHMAFNNYEELYNSESLFTPSDKSTVLTAPDQTTIYYMEKILSEDGYRIYVADDIDPLDRTPILVRWRTIDASGRTSSWQSDILLCKQTMYREDYYEHGKLAYYDEDGAAKKILAGSISSLYPNNPATPCTVEWEYWNSVSQTWEQYSVNDIVVEISGNRVIGYTTKNTGSQIEGPGQVSKAFPSHSCNVTVEAWLDPPDITVTPVVVTNLAKVSAGATISSNLNTSDFPYYSSVAGAIDGYSPFFLWSASADTASLFYGRSGAREDAPTGNITVTIVLPQTKQLNKIEVCMGDKGDIVGLSVRQSNGTIVPIWNNTPSQCEPPAWVSGGRWYRWEDPDPEGGIDNCTHVYVTITPTKWLTRHYFKHHFLWWQWGETWEYESGFDLAEVNVYNYYDPVDIERNFYKKVQFGITATKVNPVTINLADIINQHGLLPTDPEMQDSIHNMKYRIYLGDDTGDTLSDYDPYITMNTYKQTFPSNWAADVILANGYNFKGGKKRLDINTATTKGKNNIYCEHNDIFGRSRVMLEFFGCDESVFFSRKYTVKSDDSGQIYLKPFEAMSKDEMWLPKINNGRLTRKDLTANSLRDYYLPEYNGQPFYPDIPYMYVEREEASYVDGGNIQVKHSPLHVTYNSDGDVTNLRVYLDINSVVTEIPVITWNMYTGKITLDRKINFTDIIYVDYYYTCKHIIYKGCINLHTNKFHTIDFNPMPGHVYIDNDGNDRPSGELQSKSVWFYLVPAFILNYDTKETSSFSGSTLNHRIYDRTKPESEVLDEICNDIYNVDKGVIILARVDIKRPAVPTMILTTDSRRRGGGLKDNISTELAKKNHPESLFTWDIGSWDGMPYPSNGVIEITLPKSLLQENGGQFTDQEIREVINQHIAFGIYVFIQYK